MSEADKLIDRIDSALETLVEFLAKLLAVLEHEHFHITIKTNVQEDQLQPGEEIERLNGILRNSGPS